MNSTDRRNEILQLLRGSSQPLSGTALSHQLSVSRQVIVQDIALLRTAGHEILSTNQGYLLQSGAKASRVFKVHHTEAETQEELTLIVDLGGTVEDVFVYHRVYGVLKAELNLRSRRDIQRFEEDIRSGKSSLLLNVTSGYHYHTVTADSEQDLDLIQQKLQERGFLASLQPYEPVSF